IVAMKNDYDFKQALKPHIHAKLKELERDNRAEIARLYHNLKAMNQTSSLINFLSFLKESTSPEIHLPLEFDHLKAQVDALFEQENLPEAILLVEAARSIPEAKEYLEQKMYKLLEKSEKNALYLYKEMISLEEFDAAKSFKAIIYPKLSAA